MDWLYGVAAILSLGFLIVVHEGGHYFVARWCGMRIERFSIGFGPGIFKRRSKKTGTVFQIAPIPFGGFVEIRGMNIAEDVEPDDKFAYPNRPAWQRFVTIFAGPATNYLSAILLAFALFTCHGADSSWRYFGVAAVNGGYDAAGKLEIGDRIIAVDHVPILARGEHDGVGAESLVARVSAKRGAVVTLTILRDGERLDVPIQPTHELAHAKATLGAFLGPRLTADVFAAGAVAKREDARLASERGKDLLADYLGVALANRVFASSTPDDNQPLYLLGIIPSEQPDVVEIGIVGAARAAIAFPVDETKLIAGGLYDIVTNKEKADPGGPKRIYDEFARAWKLGAVTGIKLLMVLSVYLGLFNLFPLPALDGGRLVFLGYEMVTRRRANPKIEAMVHMSGIMVLGVVMVLVTLHDFHLF